MDELCQNIDHVDTMERRLRYMQCLQHIEELRYGAEENSWCSGGQNDVNISSAFC